MDTSTLESAGLFCLESGVGWDFPDLARHDTTRLGAPTRSRMGIVKAGGLPRAPRRSKRRQALALLLIPLVFQKGMQEARQAPEAPPIRWRLYSLPLGHALMGEHPALA